MLRDFSKSSFLRSGGERLLRRLIACASSSKTAETLETFDPYAFPAVLTDFDLHLMGEGTHYVKYEKLGAHVREIEGVRGVHFGVWAPNAKRVSVVGDFNAWDGRVHPMRVRGSSGIWELFLPGLDEGRNLQIRNPLERREQHRTEGRPVRVRR